MTTQADIAAAYEAHLSGHAPVASGGQANDAFEVYVLTLVLAAATNEGATVHFQSAAGVENPSPLRFRTSPGRIFAQSKNYTHACITFPSGLSYEAHIGVYVEGRAGVLHECDIAIIQSGEADFCRRTLVHPKQNGVLLTAECKFYTGKLGIALGREFLGITTDLGVDGRFLISNSDSRPVERILAHHNRKWYFRLTPLSADSETQVIALCRTVFRRAIAKGR